MRNGLSLVLDAAYERRAMIDGGFVSRRFLLAALCKQWLQSHDLVRKVIPVATKMEEDMYRDSDESTAFRDLRSCLHPIIN
jgi:hypothetical protein